MSEAANDILVRGYRVVGRVQGVGFRWWTQRAGQALGLGGHVRNLPDGSVEVQVRGRAVDLDALERVLWEGPPMARVDDVRPMEPNPATPSERFLMEAW
jgi:acylphosphatase